MLLLGEKTLGRGNQSPRFVRHVRHFLSRIAESTADRTAALVLSRHHDSYEAVGLEQSLLNDAAKDHLSDRTPLPATDHEVAVEFPSGSDYLLGRIAVSAGGLNGHTV